jgi:hypothetical protein
MARSILETSTAHAGEQFPLRPGLFVIAAIVGLDAIGRLTFWGRHHGGPSWLRWFDASASGSVPAVLAILLLAFCGLQCLRQRGEPVCWWRFAGVLCFAAAADETFQVQQRLRAVPLADGIALHAWLLTVAPLVIAGIFAAAVRLAGSLPFARRSWLLGGIACFALAAAASVVEGIATEPSTRLRGLPLDAYVDWVREACGLFGPLLLLAAAWPSSALSGRDEEGGGAVRFVGAGR